jgi:hypothetical protein
MNWWPSTRQVRQRDDCRCSCRNVTCNHRGQRCGCRSWRCARHMGRDRRGGPSHPRSADGADPRANAARLRKGAEWSPPRSLDLAGARAAPTDSNKPAAFRKALEEDTGERVPSGGAMILDWGSARHVGPSGERHGEAPRGRCRVSGGAERADPRANARPMAGVPSAVTDALRVIGERGAGPAWLENAVAAQRQALKELVRERFPLHWP